MTQVQRDVVVADSGSDDDDLGRVRLRNGLCNAPLRRSAPRVVEIPSAVHQFPARLKTVEPMSTPINALVRLEHGDKKKTKDGLPENAGGTTLCRFH